MQAPAPLGPQARAVLDGEDSEGWRGQKLPRQAGLERRLDTSVDRGVLWKVLRGRVLPLPPSSLAPSADLGMHRRLHAPIVSTEHLLHFEHGAECRNTGFSFGG